MIPAIQPVALVDEGLGNSSYLLDLGDGRALATPGHTPEHLSYLILDGARPAALFSGGSGRSR